MTTYNVYDDNISLDEYANIDNLSMNTHNVELFFWLCLHLLRVSEANEVPISSHIWVGLSTLNRL